MGREEAVATALPRDLEETPEEHALGLGRPDAGARLAVRPEEGPQAQVDHFHPVELALLPAVGLNERLGWPARNAFAFGLLAHRSTWVDGVALAPVSYVEQDVHGLQLSALVSRTANEVVGAQLSFGVNWTSGRVVGLQAGATSFAGPLWGAQVGLLNVAGDVVGAQVGVINIARTVTGTQLGLLNVARSSTAPVGINVVDDTPWRFAVQVSESSLATFEVKMGGRWLYAVASVGWVPRAVFRGGGGLGVHLGRGLGWYFEAQALAQVVWDTRRLSSWADQLAVTLQLNGGYQLAPRFAIYLGTGAQLLRLPEGVDPAQYTLFPVPVSRTLTFVPMVVLGAQF